MIYQIQNLINGVVSVLQIPIDFGPFSVSIFDIIIGQLLIILVAYVVSKLFDQVVFFMIGTSSGSILLRQLDTLTLSEACLFSLLLLAILFFIVKGLTK